MKNVGEKAVYVEANVVDVCVVTLGYCKKVNIEIRSKMEKRIVMCCSIGFEFR